LHQYREVHRQEDEGEVYQVLGIREVGEYGGLISNGYHLRYLPPEEVQRADVHRREKRDAHRSRLKRIVQWVEPSVDRLTRREGEGGDGTGEEVEVEE